MDDQSYVSDDSQGSIDDESNTGHEASESHRTSLERFFVFGKRRADAGRTLVVYSPTDVGWRARSSWKNSLNHDYVSNESMSELEEWIACDLKPCWSISSDRQEALEFLSNELQSPPRYFRTGDTSVSEDVEAERVLRHLEFGT